MRAYTQGCRALLLETALHYDLSLHHPDSAQRTKSDAYVQLMTPIVKAFLTDCGHEVTNLAMQCLGGYGYIREYGLEQYARDARIAQIYEGTNGIQALDLVGRKLPHQMGAYLAAFFVPAQEFVEDSNHEVELQPLLTQLTQHMNNLRKATIWLAREGQKNPNQAMAGATEYLRIFALTALGFAWCKQAALAYSHLRDGSDPQGFYQDKWDTAQFYMNRLAPQTYSLLASMTAGSESIMKARV
jgi:Acetyl-CoA dehydrogenase C-terminal like/Acyl-CoA dehydrogenase, C-terminal domain